MTIVLNHTIVPARDKTAAARLFAQIFGLQPEPASYFAPVKINDQMTLLFSDEDTDFRVTTMPSTSATPSSMPSSIGSRRRAWPMAAIRAISTTASSMPGAVAAAFISPTLTVTCSS